MAAAFRCSADRFRCYRITAKTGFKALIERRTISNKSPEKAPENFLSLFLRCYRPITAKTAGSAASPKTCDIQAWRLSA
jgi:hypothetical protein